MSNYTLFKAVVASALVMTPVAGARANDASIAIGGYVRTICNVSLSGGAAPSLHAGENALGQMTELCNSADGYRLVLNHPAGLVNAYFIIGGQRIPISQSATSTVLVDTSEPVFKQRDVALVLDTAAQSPEMPALSLSAEPKGMIF